MTTFAFGIPGGPEVLVILVVILLLFGAKKLPELSRSLGKSLGEFKKGKQEGDKILEDITDPPEKKISDSEDKKEETKDEPETKKQD